MASASIEDLDSTDFESESESESELGSESPLKRLDSKTLEIGGRKGDSSNSKEADESMDRLLSDVVIKGDFDGLKLLVQERGPRILRTVTPLGNTLLHLASKLGHESLVLEICSLCPSLVTKRSRSGNTPLHVGARAGHVAVVHHLIEKMISSSPSDVNIEYGTTRAVYLLGSKNHKGDTALHEALRYCRRDVAKLLIEKDPDLCRLVNMAGESPLFLAVIKGYSDVVDQILHISPSPASGGPNGWTALHASVMVNNEIIASSMTEKLLQVKPELARVKDKYVNTPLHYAVANKRASVAMVLLQHDGSLAYVQAKNGQTPLHVAARCADFEFLKMTNISENITQYCPDFEYLVDYNGNNVLHVLMERVDTDVEQPFISELLRKFALEELLNQPNKFGNTPLHLATMWRKEHFVRFLAKDSRVDKKAMNINNVTAYDIACFEYNKSLREKDKTHRRVWERIKADVDPHDQYFLRDKPLRWTETLNHDTERIAQEDVEKDAKKKEDSEEDDDTDVVWQAMLIATVAFVAALVMPIRRYESGVEAAYAVFVISDATALATSMLILLPYFVAKIFDDYIPEYCSLKIKTSTTCEFLIRFAIVAVSVAFISGMFLVLARTHSLWVGIATLVVCLSVSLFAFFLALLSDRKKKE